MLIICSPLNPKYPYVKFIWLYSWYRNRKTKFGPLTAPQISFWPIFRNLGGSKIGIFCWKIQRKFGIPLKIHPEDGFWSQVKYIWHTSRSWLHFTFYVLKKFLPSSIFKLQLRDSTEEIPNTFSVQNIYTLWGVKIHLWCLIAIRCLKNWAKSVIFHDKILAYDQSKDKVWSSGPLLWLIRCTNIVIGTQLTFGPQ